MVVRDDSPPQIVAEIRSTSQRGTRMKFATFPLLQRTCVSDLAAELGCRDHRIQVAVALEASGVDEEGVIGIGGAKPNRAAAGRADIPGMSV